MSGSIFLLGHDAPARRTTRPICFVVGGGGVWVRLDGDVAALPGADELAAAGVVLDGAQYLGRLDGEDCFAVDHAGPPPEGLKERGLRSLYGSFDEVRFAVAGRAVQVVEWDRTHRFCGRCGAATQPAVEERARVCPACGLRAFPRLSPAVIVLVHRDDRVLLARAANFPAAFYSTLAGFVEPGESLEETVAREIREEVGIEVTRLRYFGSQPWPFPHSLMIGFNVDHAGGEIQVDGKEIVDAGWFGADNLPLLPPGISIARKLIDAWLASRRDGR